MCEWISFVVADILTYLNLLVSLISVNLHTFWVGKREEKKQLRCKFVRSRQSCRVSSSRVQNSTSQVELLLRFCSQCEVPPLGWVESERDTEVGLCGGEKLYPSRGVCGTQDTALFIKWVGGGGKERGWGLGGWPSYLTTDTVWKGSPYMLKAQTLLRLAVAAAAELPTKAVLKSTLQTLLCLRNVSRFLKS